MQLLFANWKFLIFFNIFYYQSSSLECHVKSRSDQELHKIQPFLSFTSTSETSIIPQRKHFVKNFFLPMFRVTFHFIIMFDMILLNCEHFTIYFSCQSPRTFSSLFKRHVTRFLNFISHTSHIYMRRNSLNFFFSNNLNIFLLFCQQKMWWKDVKIIKLKQFILLHSHFLINHSFSHPLKDISSSTKTVKVREQKQTMKKTTFFILKRCLVRWRKWKEDENKRNSKNFLFLTSQFVQILTRKLFLLICFFKLCITTLVGGFQHNFDLNWIKRKNL